MPNTPLINGINYSWSSITVVLFNVPVVGITEIVYKRKLKKDDNYGFGQNPISRGYGNYEFEGSISLFLDEWKRIIQNSPERDPLKIPAFDIQVVYAANGRISTDKDVLRSCEFMEDELDAKQGETKLIIKVPLRIALIER